MKKIMIAVVAVALAAGVQAASYNWSNPYGLNAYGQAGDSAALYSGTAYLMNSATVSRETFIATVLGAGSGYASVFADQVVGAFYSADINAGATFTSDAYAAETSQSFYVVVIDATKSGVYVSELVDATIFVLGDTGLIFEHTAAYDGTLFDQSQTSFAGAGWYTAAPEPTSGLLLLLGVAGLALKRKCA